MGQWWLQPCVVCAVIRCPNDFTHQVTKAHNHVIPRRSLQQCAAMRRRPQHHWQLWPVPGVDKDSQQQLWAHTRAIHVRVSFRGREGGRDQGGTREGPGRETERIAIYHRERQTERERESIRRTSTYLFLSIYPSISLSLHSISISLCHYVHATSSTAQGGGGSFRIGNL